ncbi:MAG: hypothetical protein ACJ768_21815 [Gaiellaceae bacterium]
MSEPTTLQPDQAEQIRRLLGTVEDWLLHTSFEVLDDLGAFLTGLGWSTAPPERLVAWMIADLGEQTVALRHATTGGRTADGTESA